MNKRHDDAIHTKQEAGRSDLPIRKGRLTNQSCYGKRFLHVWGRVGVRGGWGGDSRKNVFQILAITDIFKQRNYQKKPCQQGRIL